MELERGRDSQYGASGPGYVELKSEMQRVNNELTGKIQGIKVELGEDIQEIKAVLKELSLVVTTIALHNQRLDILENRVGKVETTTDEIWENLYSIKSTCQLRERVYQFGLNKMESPEVSGESWRDMFLGSVVRYGLWIMFSSAVSALATAFVMSRLGGGR